MLNEPLSIPLPNTWLTSKLKDITKLIKDGTHGTHQDVLDGVPLLSAKDIESGSLTVPKDCRKISEEDYNKLHSNYNIEANDLLITLVGTIGKVAIVNNSAGKFTVQRSVGIVRFEKNVLPLYMYYFMSIDYFKKQLVRYTNASAQGGVYLNALAKTEVFIPPYQEQQKIADILSTVDRQIERTEKLINKYEHIKTGMMQDLLTGKRRIDQEGNWYEETRFRETEMGQLPEDWEIDRFESVTVDNSGMKRGPFGGALKKEFFVDKGYPVFEQQHVINNNFDNPRYFIDSNKIQELESFVIYADDMLISCSGTVGKIAFAPKNIQKGVMNQALLRIRFDHSKVNLSFMEWLFNSEVMQNKITEMSHGSTLRNIVEMRIMRNIPIPLPSFKEQTKIVNFMNSVQNKITQEQNHLGKLRSIKQGLMEDLLTGRVRVHV